MDKQIINENEFIKLCNEELRNHPDYEDGMEIIGVPKGESGSDLSGYNWKGPEKMPSIVSEVVRAVKEKYQLHVTRVSQGN
jgi:hypothetical protein